VLIAHRRFGKTVFCINELIAKAAANTLREPRYAYIAPSLVQAKDVAWGYLKRFARPVPHVCVKETELSVEFPGGARIRIYGAENAERLRGLYFDGVVLDEPADMDPRFWPEIIRPTLSDRAGWAIFIGTPKGHNAFYDLYEKARADVDWAVRVFRASETGVIATAELEAARRSMTEDQYAQEFECSFDAAVSGAFYARLLGDARSEGRIGAVSWEPRLPVHTAWDLGMRDATAIWFFQLAGSEVRIIDYAEASGQPLVHYVRLIQDRAYAYGAHILPADVEVRELGTGLSRLEVLRSLGVGNITVARPFALEDGINAVHLLLPRCWFDERRCALGVRALEQYRAEWDDRRKVFQARPRHDWTSHAADAFRYLAVEQAGLANSWGGPALSYDNRGIV
jgi:hypothetical protein